LQGIVLVAGEGIRLRPLTFTIPKPLIPILGKHFVVHILESLRDSGVINISLVIGYLGHLFKEIVGDGSEIGVKVSYVVQPQRLGIADAIYRAISENLLDDPIIVHLGDNFFGEGISRFVDEFKRGHCDVFLVLTRFKDPTRFGYVIVEDGKVKRLIEKPREPPPGGYTLSGFYAFRDPHDVGRAFKDLKPSWRGEYEITDLIQWFVDRSYNICYTITNSWWKDMGTPEDLLDLLYLVLDRITQRIEGEVVGDVRGRVIVEKGAFVEGTVLGPAYIGKNVYIGRKAVIEHYVDVEHDVKVHSGYLSRALILNGSRIDLNSARLVESIVGAGSEISLNSGTYKLIVGDKSTIKGL
jgi:glucose-1-phosphate thymidylyltransferase